MAAAPLHYNQFQTEISTLVQEHANNPEKLQVLQALAEYGDSLLNQ